MGVADGSDVPGWPIDELVEWAGLGHPARIVRDPPWASVVTWEVQGETMWGKAMCPGFSSECGLLTLLAQRCPDRVLAPLRVDAERGLMLLPDGGPTLPRSVDVATWTDVLLRCGALQREMVGSVDELLATGLPDLRPRQAVERLAQHMAADAVDDRPHLIHWLGSVADELVDDELATLQHDDLNPPNVLTDGRLIDWGDASLAHPFASLLSALMPGTAKRPGTPAEQAAMRDAYLAGWAPLLDLDVTQPADVDHLRRQADLAVTLAPIGRIDTWLRAPANSLLLYPDAITRWIDVLEDGFAAAERG